MNPPNFFAELRRRNVYKVAVAYAVVSWLVVQAASLLFVTFGAPPWAMKIFIIAVALGFPIALILAWAFELTPEGIKPTEDVDPRTKKRPKSHAWIYVVVFGAVLSIGLFLLGRYTGRNIASAARTEAVTGSSIPQKSIAVLPFENLSDDKNAAYFADGIQDEILTKLASIADLKVISRTSTAKYKSKPEDLKTVSQQLGVATVLEGSVQKAADKVRVIVQLIDARTDSHLWAKTYDRDMKDVFAIQSEVAQEIADSLHAKLSPAEARTLAIAPTKDPAAYDLFLKGEHEHRAAHSAQTAELFDRAATWYREAIGRDPKFALAMAQLVVCRLRRHWLVEPSRESELSEIGRMAKDALTLAPDLAEAHIALGVFHYYGSRQYEPALAEFKRALELQPNNSEAIQFAAFVYRRQGQWERALDELGRSLEHDPRNASILGNVAQTYCFLRSWKEAESTARRALAIDPHESTSIAMWLVSCRNQGTDRREALRLLAAFPSGDLVVPNGGTYVNVIGRRAEDSILDRNFDAALETWETGLKATSNEWHRLSAKTLIHVLASNVTGSQANAHKALPLLEARLRDYPGELRSMRALSWVYLGLNRQEDALKIAQETLAQLPPEKDAPIGTANLVSLAEIQARTGASSDAVGILRRLLSMPAGELVSIARLKIDPVWDPIRNHPGFQQLLAGKERVGP